MNSIMAYISSHPLAAMVAAFITLLIPSGMRVPNQASYWKGANRPNGKAKMFMRRARN